MKTFIITTPTREGIESLSTIADSENIIAASWETLRDSFNYRLFKIQNSKKGHR